MIYWFNLVILINELLKIVSIKLIIIYVIVILNLKIFVSKIRVFKFINGLEIRNENVILLDNLFFVKFINIGIDE